MRALGAFLLLAALAACAAQMPGMGMPSKPDPPPPVREDVKLVKCGACQHFIKQSLRTVKALREGLKPGKKVGGARLAEASAAQQDAAARAPVEAALPWEGGSTVKPQQTQSALEFRQRFQPQPLPPAHCVQLTETSSTPG